ncbi:glycosyltransferase family 2 protein [Gaetbulibacter sp. PBL-D1]|uniref:glycosyltransferase family 2 protein n=1 Tax=Gaetbulibacter sp. PBL-D1 TaxID=3422594 RepID=UPI003D2F4B09
MFNIITPTYNRAHTLPRVYKSLIQQTSKTFEWIIVDDGSTDNTYQLISEWIKNTTEFKITYHKLNINKGKSNAVNVAIDLCKEKYTIIADSDDTFIPETISDLKDIWTNNTDNSIGAIWTLTKDESGQIIGDKFPEDYWKVDFKTRVLKHNIEGEKWHCWKTSVLKSNKMILSDECHIGESHTWNHINRSFDFLCINIAHRIYFHSNDGLIATKTSKERKAKVYYNSALIELENVSLNDIIKYKFYRFYAFQYIKSNLYLKRRTNRLSFVKKLTCFVIFMLNIPLKLVRT